jgi:hypothetical protein
MMLEQSLINPQFLGRDGFNWFIGQIVYNSKDSSKGARARVRILGRHPADNQIKDENLPWAHVLTPLTLGAGNGYSGISNNWNGGEIVVGFFLDGDDEQQPVIVGALQNSDIGQQNPNQTWSEVLSKGTSSFKPFTPPQGTSGYVIATNGRIVTAKGGIGNKGQIAQGKSPVGIGSTSKEERAITQGQAVSNLEGPNSVIISVPAECASGKRKFNAIQRALVKFIQFLNTIQIINNVYINPTLNAVANIDDVILNVATTIKDELIGILKWGREEIIKRVYNLLTDFFGTPGVPPVVKIAKHAATETVIDSILCAFEKIFSQILNYVINFLTSMVGQVLSAPICAAEALLGNLLGTLSNELSESLGGALNKITSLLGSSIGQVSSIVSRAVSFTRTLLSLLSCESPTCYEDYDYELNKGWIPASNPDFQKILNYSSSISSGISSVSGNFRSWAGSVGLSTDGTIPPGSEFSCNAGIIECGFPTITIFGGGGSGASAQAVVSSAGQIIGAIVESSGSGYTTPPFVSIDSNCGEQGGGAYGYTKIKDGKVTDIIIPGPGKGYKSPPVNEEGDACQTYPTTDSGLEVTGSIKDISVKLTGVGYKNTDKIVDARCNNDIEAYPEVDDVGRIISINVVNPGSSVNLFPDLQINTTTGQGAILEPTLEFRRTDEPAPPSRKQVKTVVLCAEDHE